MHPETPPSTYSTRSLIDWGAAVAEMRANPGKWFNVGQFSPAMAHHIRNGQYRYFLDSEDKRPALVQMAEHWEVTSRRVEKGERLAHLYIRYLG